MIRNNHTVSPSQRLSWARGCLPNTKAEQKVKCCKWDNVTTLLLRVFCSSVLPGLCATGQLRVHCLLLMKSFARVGEEVTPLRPFFSHQRHLGATPSFCPKLTLQVPDWFTTSDAQTQAEPCRARGEDCTSNLLGNQD